MPTIQVAPQEGGGRQFARGRRVTTSLAEINVVPLVDVMLVLLVIFMVTAPMMQQGIDVSLPVSRRAQPLEVEPVFLTVPLSFRETRQIMLGKETISLDVLTERLRQAMATRQEADKSVNVSLDQGLQIGDMTMVLDAIRDAGILKIGLPTEPDVSRRR